MIIVLKNNTPKEEVDAILQRIAGLGLEPLYMPGTEKIVLGALGDERSIESLHLDNYSCVEKIIPVLAPYKLASRELHPAETVISLGDQQIGNPHFTVIAGPCSVESKEQIQKTGELLREEGIHFMRGGAFKPRTSPYSFQGMGEEGLKLMAKACNQFGTLVVTEVMDSEQVELVAKYADILQIGARNMQNFTLLKKVGKTQKPILLKRGMSASIQEFLMSAEYIMAEGNSQVILCERGIKTFETAYRNTLDLTAIPVLKEKTHLPVIVDPSHAAGNRTFVAALAKAALVVGADGIMVEIHPQPEKALSDGKQSLTFTQFQQLMQQLRSLAVFEGRILP
ncbi:3-deoxy-7-phosphoheptulonate synthase [Candidatus Woesearchaeota archaeon]|nr:3-deoxy-7-phosphoheptulonate synthase [Candidatus Woesearchaeota archaeon]